jgi:hypothetical protein
LGRAGTPDAAMPVRRLIQLPHPGLHVGAGQAR